MVLPLPGIPSISWTRVRPSSISLTSRARVSCRPVKSLMARGRQRTGAVERLSGPASARSPASTRWWISCNVAPGSMPSSSA